MIGVEYSGFLFQVDYTPGMTAQDVIQTLKNGKGWRFSSSPLQPLTLMDTTQNSSLDPATPVVDNRRYYLVGWLTEVVPTS